MTAGIEETRPAGGGRPVRLPRRYWLLWLGVLVNRAGTFVGPFLVFYLTRELHFSPLTATAVMTAQGCGLALSNVIGGRLADRHGRRPVAVCGLVATAFTLGSLAYLDSPWTLTPAVILLGLVGDLYRPAVYALIADIVPVSRHVRAFGLLHWANNLGISVAMVAGGLIASVSPDLIFLADAATTLGLAGLLWWAIPHSPPGEIQVGPTRSARLRVGIKSPTTMFVGITFLAFTIYFQSTAAFPLAMQDSGVHFREFGMVMAVNGIIIVTVQPLVSRLIERFPQHLTLAASYVLIGSGFGAVMFADNAYEFALTVIPWSLGEIGLAAVGPTFIVGLTSAEKRASLLGLHSAAIAAAGAVAPLLGGFVYRIDTALLWLSCAAAGCLLAAAQIRLTSEGDR